MRREVVDYHRLRASLIAALGGRCALEGTPDHECDDGGLQIDHIDGCAWEMRRVSSHCRIRRLWREFKAGVRLRLLCAEENRRDGQRRSRYGSRRSDEVPF